MGKREVCSRRRILELLGAGGMAGIAGCPEQQDDQSPTAVQSPPSTGSAAETSTETVVFTDTSVPTPTPSTNSAVIFDGGDAEAFHNALQTAANNPGATLEIKNGVYRLNPAKDYDRPTPPHFRARGLNDVTIEGNNSKFVFSDPTHAGIDFFTSSGITIRDLTFDYDPLPFTQGTIRAIDEDGKQLTIELDAGFPSLDHRMFDIASRVWASVHTSDGEFIQGIRQPGDPDKHFSAIERRGDRRFSLSLSQHSDMLGLTPGRKLVIVARGFGHILRFYKVDQPLVENVRGRTSRSVGFSFQVCAQPTVRECVLAPPPESDRLICNNADGVVFVNCLSEPTITESRLEYQEDDSIVVQHTFARVVDIVDESAIRTETIHPFVAKVGDPFTAISPAGVRKGRLPAIADVEVEQRVGPAETRAKPRTLTFEAPISDTLSVGDFVGNLATASHDFSITNNVVRNTRVNLIRVTASQGVVGNNVVEGARRNAIELECDTDDRVFAPKGWASDVIVRNNQIKRPGLNNFAGDWPAGIRVHHENPLETPTQGNPNRNITIVGNTIMDGAYCGIMIEDARDIHIENNDLSALNRVDYPGIGDAGFVLRDVENVALTHNTVTGKNDKLQYFGIERESENIQTADNRLRIDGASESPDLISQGRLQLSFNRAVKVGGRYLSFLCRNLALVDDQDDVIVSVDVGADESGVSFGAGVHGTEQNANEDWRWFGSQTGPIVLFFARSHLKRASILRLRGEPYEKGITAAVYVGEQQGGEIQFGERRTRRFTLSLN